MATAPTPAFIHSAGYDFTVYCPSCRLLVQPKDLALSLMVAGKGDVPIDKLTFRCDRCGGRGEPTVNGSGNLLLGRPRIWPPTPPA